MLKLTPTQWHSNNVGQFACQIYWPEIIHKRTFYNQLIVNNQRIELISPITRASRVFHFKDLSGNIDGSNIGLYANRIKKYYGWKPNYKMDQYELSSFILYEYIGDNSLYELIFPVLKQ